MEQLWLAMFFYKYSYADQEVRGIDTSVTRLFTYSWDLVSMKWDVATHEHLELDPDDDPLYVFEVNDDDELSIFIGSQPCIRRTDSLTGRCTRYYRVYDSENKRLLLLKDTWMVNELSVEKEGDVYKDTQHLDACHVWYVLNYESCTQQHMQTDKLCSYEVDVLDRLKGHCHYRLVFEEFGMDIRECKTIGDVISVRRDCPLAHQDAYEKVSILHRDISIGNMIVLE
ncbi:hypothetical protein L218DRAFT_1061899 [Marasmius fiardii PR-910]|nr:hypothetical protein L218DRAFT_1061899 [Marasmius fiardii PR-910]